MVTFVHEAKEHDTSYNFNGSTTKMTIGAMTYTGVVNVYDFATTLPHGSASGSIQIKRFSSIADQVTLQIFGDHDYTKVCMNPLMPIIGDYKKIVSPTLKSESIIIGNDVWIGNNVKILSNIEIGDGAVIGANAVVSKNIPPYAIAVGNPIKVIKYRFPEDVINNMLEIKWWDWDNQKILENCELLFGNDIQKFINIHRIVK
jgi:carbonic anhydrase/acetyltransferase-like protein (isoleucine patch superfamily)